MKGLFVMLAAALAVGNAWALDRGAWLDAARELVANHERLGVGESQEDGLYCIVVSEIREERGVSAERQIEVAVLHAKSRLTAYIHGETVSGVREFTKQGMSWSAPEGEGRVSRSRYRERIETRVDALVRGLRFVGQVSEPSKSYVVCVTTEEAEDVSSILLAAQQEYGQEGTTMAVGEAASREQALQKALQGAVEQVLGAHVVGYDKVSSEAGFRSQVFSGADGLVEKYRVLSESAIAYGVRIEVVAKVAQQALLDNYRNYMRFLGDPMFYLESSSPDLASLFTDFFTEMGLRMTEDPYQAAFIIRCSGNFRSVRHPSDGRLGTQLSLRFRVCDAVSQAVRLDMKNDPRKATSFVGQDSERQREICADKAFDQMREPLHERIQSMVGRLVSEKMESLSAEE